MPAHTEDDDDDDEEPSYVVAKELGNEFRDIGADGFWSVSSSKPGNGVSELSDRSKETYWQSDGSQPHLINIQFEKKMHIAMLAIYLDYALDESYTPKKIKINSGSTFHDLKELRSIELHEPSGWVTLRFQDCQSFFMQISIISMHQNGRDTHIRQVRLFSPRIPFDLHADPTTLGFTRGQPLATFALLR